MTTLSKLSDLTGRVAVLTGGAGHIGRAMAGALCEMGAEVAVLDRAEKASFDNSKITYFQVDLEDETARTKVANEVMAHYERIDILINNAGFVGDSGLTGWATHFEDQSIDTWRRALEVNLTAPFHLVQLFANHLRANGCGSVINVGSIYGMLGPDMGLYEGTEMGNPAAYAASKGGLLQITRWLSTSLAPEIRVNSICPGGIERGQDEQFSERYIKRTPMGRMGREEDIIGAVAYFASDQSAWVTGQNLAIEGGWSAW